MVAGVVPGLPALYGPITVTRAVAGSMVTNCARVAGLLLATEPYSTPVVGWNASPVIP